MERPQKPMSDRIYRALLRLLPFDFRSEFGGEMELAFQEQRSELRAKSGLSALIRMWWQTISDLIRMAPREHISVLWQDLRFALRMMRKNAGFTFAAVLILGLGIGANTSIFSVVNSVLLKPLPYINGDQLVVLRNKPAKLDIEDARYSVPEIKDFRERNTSLNGLVEYHSMTFTLYGSEAHQVRTGVVSPQFFDLFGVRALIGRTFVQEDDRVGGQPVLVLSYEFWKRAESGNPNIIGKKYRMNDQVHVVIGVLPPIPQYPNENDIYMPTSSCPSRSANEMITNRNMRMMSLFGRLKPGVKLEHCRADLAAISKNLARDFPGSYPPDAGIVTEASFLREDLTKRARSVLLVLLGAAAFVLLIACANVANLILARMVRRESELMIRTALGAGNGRLLRQLLTESFVLALMAAGVGLIFAAGSLELLTEFASRITPRAREVSIDNGVLLFTILCASATTIVFGSVAALHARHDLSSGLKEAGRTGSEAGSKFAQRMMVTLQIAFSFVLLIAAGLMLRSFVRIINVDPGFVAQRVYAVSLGLNGHEFMDHDVRYNLSKRIEERLRELPGVMSVAVSSSFPLDPDNMLLSDSLTLFQVEGDIRPMNELIPVRSVRRVSPEYFKTLGIPLISGRPFRDSDRLESPQVVLINRNLALKRWGKADPVGKRITTDDGESWKTIVGVVGDVKEFGLHRDTPYQLYKPLAQEPFVGSVLLRTVGDPVEMTEQIRRKLKEVEPRMAIAQMLTLEQARKDSYSSPRTLANLFGLFAALALIISVFGIGSMLALWVKQRMREIGIRMALGASPHQIFSELIQQGLILALAGLAIGLGGALLATRMLTTLLFKVKPTDIGTYLLVSILLLLGSIIACYLPSRRAMKVDPMIALRYE